MAISRAAGMAPTGTDPTGFSVIAREAGSEAKVDADYRIDQSEQSEWCHLSNTIRTGSRMLPPQERRNFDAGLVRGRSLPHRHRWILRLIFVHLRLPPHRLRLGDRRYRLRHPSPQSPRHGIEQARPRRFRSQMRNRMRRHHGWTLRLGKQVGFCTEPHDGLWLQIRLPLRNRPLLQRRLMRLCIHRGRRRRFMLWRDLPQWRRRWRLNSARHEGRRIGSRGWIPDHDRLRRRCGTAAANGNKLRA
jgi:hypothetical protein